MSYLYLSTMMTLYLIPPLLFHFFQLFLETLQVRNSNFQTISTEKCIITFIKQDPRPVFEAKIPELPALWLRWSGQLSKQEEVLSSSPCSTLASSFFYMFTHCILSFILYFHLLAYQTFSRHTGCNCHVNMFEWIIWVCHKFILIIHHIVLKGNQKYKWEIQWWM